MNYKITKISAALVLLLGYTVLLTYWMLWGFGRTPQAEYMYNLQPFITISHFLEMDAWNGAMMINLLGNIGVFIPFGILIPLVFNRGVRGAGIIFLAGLFVLESAQLLTRRGSFDVDDFILNSVGFLIGYGMYRLIRYWVGSK
ncbi:VanZ like family protein [compost metagenome]